MSAARINGAGPGLTPEYSERSTAPAKRGNAKGSSKPTPALLHESHISSVIASRQPPRMPLSDGPGEAEASPVARLFVDDLSAFSTRKAEAIAGDIAAAFLDHADDAAVQKQQNLSQAFEALGDLLRNYEHLRILRTGEMG